MNPFIYDHSDYRTFFADFAAFLGVECKGNIIEMPEERATGQATLLDLPGLQAFVNDYVLNDDFTWRRVASLPEVFTMRVDYVEINNGMHVVMDNEVFKDNSEIYSSIAMTSSRHNIDITLKKGTLVKSVNILIKPEWLTTYLPEETVNDWLHYLRVLKLSGINMVPMDFNTREALFNIISMQATDPAYNFKAYTKIIEIADYYFKKINLHSQEWEKQQKFFEDIDKIIELDVYLTRDFNQPIPTLDEMAVSVHMSTSKLKGLFKKIYGQSVYEYFNISRLNKARHLLQENNLSIKEVAWQMGYSAVSNFSVAFKKQFNISPGDITSMSF